MTPELNQVEIDYTEFLAQRRGVPLDVARADYLRVRSLYNFGGLAFKKLMLSLYNLFSPIYGDTEREIYETHKFHAALHLYRHIGYSYSAQQRYTVAAEKIVKLLDGSAPVVVDYGCGLGYIPMEMYAIAPDTVIYLVDIDGMVLDFATWRYAKHGVPYAAIRVKRSDPYPQLPPHNVCLALESMEHIPEPLRAYANINAAMEPGGYLVGDFGDHSRQLFHVSPNLQPLREAVARNFVQVQPKLFRKVR